MSRVSSFFWFSSLAAVGLVAASAGCPGTTSGTDGGKSSTSSGGTFCTTDTECRAVDEFLKCVDGECLLPCSTHDTCNPEQFCSRQHYCQTGCRETAACTATQVCANGACVERSQVTACTSKAQCTTPPRICVDQVCVDPPEHCASVDDCPGSQICNNFTHVCQAAETECSTAADCNGKPQCTNGCTCNSQGQCVATPTCTQDNEATVCGNGKFCDSRQSPARCSDLPACTKQSECDAVRLACSITAHLCQRTPNCNDSSACSAPFSQCASSVGFCQEPSCLNGGRTCSGTDVCRSDGTCGVPTTTTCQGHTDCPTTPQMQYCDATSQTCRTGCRDNGNCSSPQVCNENHVCGSGGSSSSSSSGGADADCDMTTLPCAEGFTCLPVLNKCAETCQEGMCPPCPITGYGCMDLMGMFKVCSALATAPDVDAGCP